jgi:hypothetical protein
MQMSITDQTFDQFKAAVHAENEIRKAAGTTVNIATGLVAYDLQAPAKNLYPVNTPILATLPRVGGGTGTATNWRQVTAITGSGYDASGWVPEGVRAGAMSLTEANKLATYVTIGEEEAVTFEAESAARGFEDILATSAMRLLQKMRLKEEHACLGGNTSVALGTTGTPTLSASGSGATLPALTYDVVCVAMTYEGYNNWKAAGSSFVTGLIQTKSVSSQDGSSFTLNGGYGQKSAIAQQAVTLGQTLFCSVAAVTGAVAYAWYVGGRRRPSSRRSRRSTARPSRRAHRHRPDRRQHGCDGLQPQHHGASLRWPAVQRLGVGVGRLHQHAGHGHRRHRHAADHQRPWRRD